jgi:16S rRNA (cytosine1402-N4)-methyltransferase
LVEPLVSFLQPRPGEVVFDGTVGLGGHAAVLLPRIAPDGRYIGVDVDEQMVRAARERLAGRWGEALELVVASYTSVRQVLERFGLRDVDHVLLDLGVNSAQLTDASRGFSFEREGPLDMRYDRTQKRTATELVNALSEGELADLIYYNAQEGHSRKIAKRICQLRRERRITTTGTLARAVEAAIGGSGRSASRTNPATRVFQALRIAVNRELDNLREFLEQATECLRPGGKLAVIAFHSLEDGIVKRFLREAKARGEFETLTRKPVIADSAERRANPRSRSAKLRVARRL